MLGGRRRRRLVARRARRRPGTCRGRTGQVKEGDVPSKRKILNIKSLEAEQKRAEVTRLEALKKKVEDALSASPKLAAMKSQIRLDMTRDGLRIQIVDEQSRPMFDSGSAVVKPYMRELLREIGHVLSDVPNRITLEGTPTRSRSAAASAATATGSSRATAPTRRGARSSPAACPRTACCWSRAGVEQPVRAGPSRRIR
jgi:hypothetical protein